MENTVNFYVSTGGCDSFPGTVSHPFATLTCARNVARKINKDGLSGVYVWVDEGTYYLNEPLRFDPQDSGTPDCPVRYTALPSKHVIISGARRLVCGWEPWRDGILRAPFPDAVNGHLSFSQLFVNGRRQIRARYPNYDRNAQYFNGFSADAFGAKRAARWKNPVGGFIHAMHKNLWGDMHYVITGKDKKGQVTYKGGWQNNF